MSVKGGTILHMDECQKERRDGFGGFQQRQLHGLDLCQQADTHPYTKRSLL